MRVEETCMSMVEETVAAAPAARPADVTAHMGSLTSLLADDASSEAVGRAAQQYSTCGSAKKRPDAKMPQLRGAPGELTFRRGAMAPEFERVAFAAPVGELQPPFQTQFGWHLLLVNKRG